MAGWTIVPNGNASAWKPVQEAPAPQSEPSQPQGFFGSLAHAFGMSSDDTAARQREAQEHPVRSLIETQPAVQVVEGLYNGAKRIGGELVESGKSALDRNMPGAAVHAIKAIPIVGPALARASDQAPVNTPNEPYLSRVMDAAKDPGVMGTVLGASAQAAPAVLGGLDMATSERPLLAQIPTRARAGEKFQTVMSAAKDQPVSLTRASEPLMRAFDLSERGAQLPKVVRQLVRRTTEPDASPLTYSEARDFASNMSRMSSKDVQSLTPAMRSQVGKTSKALNADVGDTASSVGQGENYANAMREYARASNLRKAMVGAAKYAVPVAVGGGIASKLAKELLPR